MTKRIRIHFISPEIVRLPALWPILASLNSFLVITDSEVRLRLAGQDEDSLVRGDGLKVHDDVTPSLLIWQTFASIYTPTLLGNGFFILRS
jgi:hypothetical protein